jgi:signal transduction histidine kinase
MRLLIYELRPPVLVDEGLEAGIQARLDAVEGRSGVATALTTDLPEPLSKETEEALYRIAQEALNNSLKHSRGKRIEVELRQSGSLTVMEIRDNGVGFDPMAAEISGGLGLRGMAERVDELGGELTVRSEPGSGTCIRVEVPT